MFTASKTTAHFRLIASALSVALLLLPTGCGNSRGTQAKVAGKVLLDDEPLSGGNIRFVPEKGRPVGGMIAEDGSFQLSAQTANQTAEQGIPLGTYSVEISSTRIIGDETSVSITPTKYTSHQTSGIEVVVDEPTDSIVIRLSSEDEQEEVTGQVASEGSDTPQERAEASMEADTKAIQTDAETDPAEDKAVRNEPEQE